VADVADKPLLNMTGDRVALGPLTREILPLIIQWNNDFEVSRHLAAVRPATPQFIEEAFEASCRARDEVHFVIYEKETLRPVGSANLVDIRGGAAEYSIVIGEQDCWGKGFGTEVTRLVAEYGFRYLGLHNILLVVHATNEAGVKAYTRAGFQVIGRRREMICRDGRRYDLIYMDCTASDFFASL
jgi:RimJ/RimL family protein N-acetyltransferase